MKMTPAEKPLAMPVQELAKWRGNAEPLPAARRTQLARVFVFSLTLAITTVGTYGMYQVISPVKITWLQIVFASFFAFTFTWISFACASACLGFWVLLRKRCHAAALAPPAKMGRTALLMPVYNEDPNGVFETLLRMGQGLVWQGAGRRFDIFVLSDTRNDLVAQQEEVCFRKLRSLLGPKMGVYYRRRADNHHRKAGNIADFVQRWGGAYDHMVVLDADSDMSAETLIKLARSMAADSQAGIIQTLPLLRNRWTPFARMTQFAGRVYGPVVAAGLAEWHGFEGNYWGHNAIIRTAAFASAAGLPELKGRKPFGGHILSHDFVEAALMRRAGWKIYMLPMLGGSYEETPPSLGELATRDRRWAQGNLQHIKVVTAKGLNWVSRVHLVQGIMSYLASPLWLLLLVAGLGLAIIARYTEPNYFPDGFSLFPAWPVFNPELAFKLLGATAIVLYLPKLMGLMLALRDPELRSGCGGVSGLLKSFAAETVLSMLISPVMMLIQSRCVFDILIGRDSGWNAQNRVEGDTPFLDLAERHAAHAGLGLTFGIVAWAVSCAAFLWLLPIVIGLMLAPVMAWATGLAPLGRWMWSKNLFRIPEEQAISPSSGGEPASVLLAAE